MHTLLWVLVGCAPQTSEVPCEALAGLERDTCLADQILALPGNDVAAVQALGTQIQDGMVRQAAVLRWTRDNAGQIPREAGREMCHAMPRPAGRSGGSSARLADAVLGPWRVRRELLAMGIDRSP